MAGTPDPSWHGIDTSIPNPARMYDYLLGGAANFDADRRAVEKVLVISPHGRRLTRDNRAFLRRVVRFLTAQGVRQFLDLGSGIPTIGNVHEIAQRSAPDARVVYVDIEPVAVHYSRRVLADDPLTAVLQTDITDAAGVIDQAGALLDFDQPVAVLAFAVLHFTADAAVVRDAVGTYRDRTAPGSWLAISHATAEDAPVLSNAVAEEYRSSSMPVTLRTRAEVRPFFDGYELVPPGVVPVPDWRPDTPDPEPDDVPAVIIGGVGHK